MATLVGTQSSPVALLRSLVELDYDAVEADEAAIEKLRDPGYRQQMESFCADHRRHIAELGPVIRELGGRPVLGPDIKRVLTEGKVRLGALLGDRAILLAMRTNEEDTNTAYKRAVRHGGVDPRVQEILVRNLADERRHRAWLIDALAEGRAERPSAPIL